jgi:large subunit ribosomal protein L3
MKKAILGKKVGMTQVFAEDGTITPVTVVEAGPCTVIRKKTVDRDGYEAVCVGFEDIREGLVNQPKMGEFKKADVAPKRHICEFKFENTADYEVGQDIKADIFEAGEYVDISGISIGHGFTGPIRRWNQSRGPMTHGSKYHRGPGSMGACSTPSRVLKGKRLGGHWGSEKVTVQNLQVVRVDAERNMLLVKGSIPGRRGALVTVRQAVKK